MIRTHVSEHYNWGWWGRLWAYATFLASGLWASLFRANQRYDVVIVTSPPLLIGLLGVWLARLSRAPLILEVRDLWPDAPVQLGVLTHPLLVQIAYRLEAYLYRRAQHIVVLTEGYRDVLINQKKVAPARITVIPNAADFALTDAITHHFDCNAFRQRHAMVDGFWIVYAGAHGLVNRLSTVLDAAGNLADTPARFLFIGDGTEKLTLQNEVRRRGLKNVRFVDKLPKQDVIPFLLAADVGLTTAPRLPIFRTVLTNKLFDYFSCRLPVLTMLDGESRRLVEAADAGLFVEPENAEALVWAIQYYLNHPQLIRQHGENGYRYAQRHFDRRRLAQQYVTILSNVSARW
ncbi:MAG: glycosyltransferase family 4 protein [Bacteroidetes bacterium]|nr:glycosyltransferase family 4 protein [Fibrella sp.]